MLTPPALRDLRQEMSGVGDEKIRRIVAWMDLQAMPAAAQASSTSCARVWRFCVRPARCGSRG